MQNKNILIVGPPGSGKTYSAKKRVIEILWGQEKAHVEQQLKQSGMEEYIDCFDPELFLQSNFEKVIQLYKPSIRLISLHEGYSYNDFVEGISIKTSSGKLQYQYVDRVFKDIINEILEHNAPGFLILDDIHRVNISSVLGELLNAIENRTSKVTLSSGKTISVPENLYIIATMSTGQTKFKPDYAFMRRFDIERRETNEDILRKALEKHSSFKSSSPTESQLIDSVIDKIAGNTNKGIEGFYGYYNRILNNIASEFREDKLDYLIGYTYFLPGENCELKYIEEVVQHKIHHQVIPLLEQYAKDGIIDARLVPRIERTNTKYTRDYSQVTEQEIKLIADEETAQFADDIYRNNTVVPDGKRYKKNGRISVNKPYLMIYEIVKDMIKHNLINTYDLIEIFTDNKKIICTRADIVKGGGGLWVEENLADKIIMNDPTPKNQFSLYNTHFHYLIYGKTRYRMVSKLSGKNFSCEHSIKNCHATSVGQNSNPFKATKMLVYYYLKKLEENYENYITEISNPKERMSVITELKQLQADIKIIEQLTDYFSHKGQAYYFEANDREVNLVNLIRSLPTWNDMITGKLKGVYKKMDRNYQQIMENTGVRQMILQGPPGTSKTYGAKEFLCEQAKIISSKGESWLEEDLGSRKLVSDTEGNYELPEIGSEIFWDIVQFHPSYCYEDFVRGISVTTNNDNTMVKGIIKRGNTNYDLEIQTVSSITYKTVNRTLGKMAELAAKKENENKKFYLIIDEINRANLATVFGELIYALEYRNSSVATPYQIGTSSDLKIPENMFIIGTMNTADKSIGSIDYAIRRRFLFFPMLPDMNVVIKSIKNTDVFSSLEVKLFYAISKLFDTYLNEDDYNKDDVQIGHTYFIRKSDDESVATDQMKHRFLYQVVPVLREYIKDGVLVNEGTESKIKDVLNVIINMAYSDSILEIDALYKDLENKVNDEKYINILKNEFEEGTKE